jgi:hypothetical protein
MTEKAFAPGLEPDAALGGNDDAEVNPGYLSISLDLVSFGGVRYVLSKQGTHDLFCTLWW